MSNSVLKLNISRTLMQESRASRRQLAIIKPQLSARFDWGKKSTRLCNLPGVKNTHLDYSYFMLDLLTILLYVFRFRFRIKISQKMFTVIKTAISCVISQYFFLRKNKLNLKEKLPETAVFLLLLSLFTLKVSYNQSTVPTVCSFSTNKIYFIFNGL